MFSGDGVLSEFEVLYGAGSAPTKLQKRYLFRIPSIHKWYPSHGRS